MLPQYIFLHVFTFNLFVSLYLNCLFSWARWGWQRWVIFAFYLGCWDYLCLTCLLISLGFSLSSYCLFSVCPIWLFSSQNGELGQLWGSPFPSENTLLLCLMSSVLYILSIFGYLWGESKSLLFSHVFECFPLCLGHPDLSRTTWPVHAQRHLVQDTFSHTVPLSTPPLPPPPGAEVGTPPGRPLVTCSLLL